MTKNAPETPDESGVAAITVDTRVCFHQGRDDEAHGVVVDDFGDAAGHAVVIGDNHIADPARRWAIMLDNGVLVFSDSEHLVPE